VEGVIVWASIVEGSVQGGEGVDYEVLVWAVLEESDVEFPSARAGFAQFGVTEVEGDEFVVSDDHIMGNSYDAGGEDGGAEVGGGIPTINP
jgi:hypothetical protein